MLDFGYQYYGAYQLTGTVFYDTGSTTDGLTDTYALTDTQTYPGVAVYLYQPKVGYPIGQTTTDANGPLHLHRPFRWLLHRSGAEKQYPANAIAHRPPG